MKRLRVILLFLLLGAIVNVAVAWGIALDVVNRGNPSERIGPGLTSSFYPCWILTRHNRFGSTLLAADSVLPQDHSDVAPYFESTMGPFLPRWSQMNTMPRERMSLIEDGRGWPMRSFSCGFRMPADKSIQYFDAWIIRESPDLTWIPLRPIWFGFLFNTLAYGFIIWLIFPGPFVLRRLIRRKRGLCVKCAYDLRGAEHEACPECGQQVAHPSLN